MWKCNHDSGQQTLMGMGESVEELVDKAILTLQTFAPKDRPYYGCFSGGKDSITIKEVARLADVSVNWYYNQTTIDPPELVRFIRDVHPDVTWKKPEKNFFTAMLTNGFPTRRSRWCCKLYKERQNPIGETLILGVRAAESPRRKAAWKVVTYHTRTRTNAISPILGWKDEDVWRFIRKTGIPYCSLYDEGFTRLGCIGCPMGRTSGRVKQFKRWPGYEKAWKRAFRKIWEKRAGKPQRGGKEWFGSAKFKTWEELFDWWLSDDRPPGNGDDGGCQGVLDLWS